LFKGGAPSSKPQLVPLSGTSIKNPGPARARDSGWGGGSVGGPARRGGGPAPKGGKNSRKK